MVINRRRAASSAISRAKKIDGHINEGSYAEYIGGQTISGTQKSDVEDKLGYKHSVKSGKKWQVFLYSHSRISSSQNLNILEPCLDAFTEDPEAYFRDRIACVEYKEAYVAKYGRPKAKLLLNEEVSNHVGDNLYIDAKEKLSKSTSKVVGELKNKNTLRNFLAEALFNIDEVIFLAIKDDTFKKDKRYKVFHRDDVLDVLMNHVFPEVSKAGNVPEDYNVGQQKTLLCYKKSNGRNKNIVEIEIRNDSATHYKQVRFNMYSKDTLALLVNDLSHLPIKKMSKDNVWIYGAATNFF
jgi:uncharacterized protein (DUF1697 family)